MKNFKAIFFLVIVVGLQACGLRPEVGYDYILDATDKEHGLVVMSLSAEGTSYLTMRALYNDQEKVIFPMFSEHGVPGVDWHNPGGRLLVARLPVGKYTFYEWFKDIIYAGYSSQTQNEQPFEIEFEAKAGKIVYIGNVHVNMLKENMPIYVLDKRKRDLGLMLERYKNINKNDVQIKLSSVNAKAVRRF